MRPQIMGLSIFRIFLLSPTIWFSHPARKGLHLLNLTPQL